MGLRLKNSSGNYVELNAPSSIATDFGLTLPVNDGNASQYLQTDGAGTLSWQTVTTGAVQSFSAVNLSGSSQEFTGIPSDAYKIVITFQNLSFSTTSNLEFVLGTGSTPTYTTSGYYFSRGVIGSTNSTGEANNAAAFDNNVFTGNADQLAGQAVFTKANDNNWVLQCFLIDQGGANIGPIVGFNSLGGALTAIKIEGSAGTLDSGNASIWYLT